MVCEKCNGICCTKFVKFITAHDALRIAKKLKIDPTYFLDYYTAEIDSIYPNFKINGEDYVLGLDNKLGTIRECIFLMNIGNTRRCGIHKFRPLVCRTYPFIIDKDDSLDFVEDHICPKQWWPEGEEKEEYLKYINQFKEEIEQYKEIVEAWNESKGGSFIEFLDFIFKEVQSGEKDKEMEMIELNKQIIK